MENLKIAIVGCGAMTQNNYLPVIIKMIPKDNIYLVEPNELLLKDVSNTFAIKNNYKSHKDLPIEIDIAIIVTPHYLHKEISVDLMRKGINVFCEKPMALSIEESEEIIKVAEETKSIFRVAQIRRFFHSSQMVKQLIQSGNLGKIKKVDIEEGMDYNWPTTSGFFFNRKYSGGGVLFDTGAHVLDLLLWWFDTQNFNIDYYEDDSLGGVEAKCSLGLSSKDIDVKIRFSRLSKLNNKYIIHGEKAKLLIKPFDTNKIVIYNNKSGKNRFIKCVKKPDSFHDMIKKSIIEFWELLKKEKTENTLLANAIECEKYISLINDAYSKRDSVIIDKSKLKYELETYLENYSGKIAITGASGFIGCRIAERLHDDYNIKPICLIHNWSRASRLSRMELLIQEYDLLKDNPEDINMLKDVDVLIHCAVSTTGSDKDKIINVEGTEKLLKFSKKYNIKHFIFVSTVSVHDYNAQGSIDEKYPYVKDSNNNYINSKIDAEKLCQKYIDMDLSVTIVRLPVVYGPFGKVWSMGVLKRLRNDWWKKIDGVDGIANAVYIDDVVTGIFRTISYKKNSIGNTYFLNGPNFISWDEYYRAYLDMISLDSTKEVSKNKYLFYRFAKNILRGFVKSILSINEDIPKKIFNFIRDNHSNKAKIIENIMQTPISDEQMIFFNSKTIYSIEKAKKEIGYNPIFNFNEGMKITLKWLLDNRFIEEN